MHQVSTPLGRSFLARPDESLLDAALRNGVVLDHSCRTGRCGTCKGRVLSGETVATHDETSLDEASVAEGYVLTCVRQARGPVSIEVDDLGDINLPEAKTLPCRIQAINRLSPDVMAVTLRLPPTADLPFLPGQYVDVIGAEGLRRSYSVANAPRPDKQIELHVREVLGGAMSHYWFQLAQVNDLLRLRGPLGTFFLRDQTGVDLALLATGTGMAPVKAILEGLSTTPEAERPRSVTVYWGGRRQTDLYWSPPTLPWLRYVPVLSRPEASWQGARGYVQDALLADHSEPSKLLVYACGSDAMIHSARTQLMAAGLPERQFRSDAFVCSAGP